MSVVLEIVWQLLLVSFSVINIVSAGRHLKNEEYIWFGLFVTLTIWMWLNNIDIFLS